jgi:hypothetical protein
MQSINVNTEISKLFSNKWKMLDSKTVKSIDSKNPGVYLIAWSDKNLSEKEPENSDIFYVGMSNAKGGVKSRLLQFLNGINTGKGHSAGNRFFTDYCKGKAYKDSNHSKKFYFVENTIVCNVNRKDRTADDLITMGEICLLEYSLLAHIKSKVGKEPELNKK